MAGTIFFAADLLHLGTEKGDGDDEEEKAERPSSFFLTMKDAEGGEIVEEAMTDNLMMMKVASIFFLR